MRETLGSAPSLAARRLFAPLPTLPMVLSRPGRAAVLWSVAAAGALLALLSLLLAAPSDARTLLAAFGVGLACLPVAVRAAGLRTYGDVQVGLVIFLFGVAAFSYGWMGVGSRPGVGPVECAVAVCLVGALCGAALGRAAASWAALLVALVTLLQRHFDLPLVGADGVGLAACALLALPLGAILAAALPGGAVRAAGGIALASVAALAVAGPAADSGSSDPGDERRGTAMSPLGGGPVEELMAEQSSSR